MSDQRFCDQNGMFHKGGEGRARGFGFGGFHLQGKKAEPQLGESALGAEIPPPSTGRLLPNKHGYLGLQAITQNALDATYGLPRKRPKTEEEYFDEEDDDHSSQHLQHHRSSSGSGSSRGGAGSQPRHQQLEYIPAPGSPSWEAAQEGGSPDSSRSSSPSPDKRQDSSSSEEDPLDAYMAGLQKQAKKDSDIAKEKEAKLKGIRDDIENEDDEESYYRYIEENPNAGADNQDSDVELEYDEDGNPIAPIRSKYIDPLPPIDHSTIEYGEFTKNFYEEPPDIVSLDEQQVSELKAKLGLKTSGVDPPKPVTSFAHFGFEERLMKAVRKSEYTQPTPIQAQGVPVALRGRDMIGIAKTGSGKTAAFIWPMIVHIMDQRDLEPEEGPVGLILAPTRELAQQIYLEAKRFGKVYGLRAVCCFGGGSKWEQSQALQEGAEIVVATPGRMIDLIKMKATNLRRVTFLVLDEADRMFDMGFEPQVRSLCDHVRPDRQTLMFSATFKKKVERLARVALTDPVRVVQGELGEANQDVTQHVLVLPAGPNKWAWLTSNLVDFTTMGSVLIFVTKKANSEELTTNLKARDFSVCLMHGDMDQNERTKVIASFKKKEFPILVATDVAARGLDIPHIKTVVNYDIARDIDTHTHRVGRTGRAGDKGVAYTLVTSQDKEFAGHLVRNLEGANQEVPRPLMDLAMQSSWFRKSRYKQGQAKKLTVGGRGLGYKERPGLGAPPASMGPMTGSAGQAGLDASSTGSRLRGPQTDRLSAMKAAFQLQYKSQFQASSDLTFQKTLFTPPPPPPPLAPPAPVQPVPPENCSSNSSEPTKQRRRKSRWDD